MRDVQAEKSRLDQIVDSWEELTSLREDLDVIVELSSEDEDAAAEEFNRTVAHLEERIQAIEKAFVLSGPDDPKNAFIEIHAGSGGLEAQDWAEMLLRMYLRWAEQNDHKARIIDILADDAAGIKSATVEVQGEWAFGYLKAETGVHRLVRISPFDAAKRRHTSFASIMVSPEVDDDIDIDIDEKDLRIDTYRSSGAGGQHVNKTDSAVRLTHLPTGIVTSCQNERSQHKNKAFAMKVLKAKLYERELAKQKEEMSSIQGEKKEIAWGSQIRSYVLQPYQMVKDHRTGLDVGNVEAVLDGDLNTLMDAFLMMEASRGSEKK